MTPKQTKLLNDFKKHMGLRLSQSVAGGDGEFQTKKVKELPNDKLHVEFDYLNEGEEIGSYAFDIETPAKAGSVNFVIESTIRVKRDGETFTIEEIMNLMPSEYSHEGILVTIADFLYGVDDADPEEEDEDELQH